MGRSFGHNSAFDAIHLPLPAWFLVPPVLYLGALFTTIVVMLRGLLVVLAVGVLGGCTRPTRPVELTQKDLCLADEAEYEALFETCLEVLRERRFKPDRVDRRGGVITTFPVTSQQVFEFWRDDVETPYDLMEASLMSIRRRVEIHLRRADQAAPHTLVVAVYREKFSTPDRQYNSSAAAFRFFSPTLPATTGERIVPARDDVWLAAGRDGLLERRLLREITERVPGPL